MNSTYVFSSEIEAKDFYTRFEWNMRKRSEGRDTNEVEMKIFADFIINVPNKNLWSYPLKITHQDRPDFLIETTQKRIGIEVTEQWSKHFGKALSMSEHIDGFIEYSDFNLKNDNKKKSGKEIARLVSKTSLTGPPSMGYQEEVNWIQRTKNTIERKIKKFLPIQTIKVMMIIFC